jgi:hypothetical protein
MIKTRPKYSTDLYGTIFTSIILDRLREDDTNGGIREKKGRFKSKIFVNNYISLKFRYSLFGDSENRENNYLKIRDLLSIALFNILGTHYVIHI